MKITLSTILDWSLSNLSVIDTLHVTPLTEMFGVIYNEVFKLILILHNEGVEHITKNIF